MATYTVTTVTSVGTATVPTKFVNAGPQAVVVTYGTDQHATINAGESAVIPPTGKAMTAVTQPVGTASVTTSDATDHGIGGFGSVSVDDFDSTVPAAYSLTTDVPPPFGSKLLAFRSALANRFYAPCKIVFSGASTLEGQGATVWGRHATARYVNGLRSLYPVSGVTGGVGWIPAMSAVTGQTGYPAALSGGAIRETGERVMGWNSARLSAAGHTVTWTFTGTSATLVYERNATASMTFTVDGGAPETVNTGGAYTRWMTHSTGALSQGAHTVVVTWASGGNIALHGLIAYNQDEAAGITAFNTGHAGFKLSDVDSFFRAHVTDTLTAIQPHLVVCMWGYNDWHLQVPVATFKTALTNHVADIRSAVTVDPSIVLAVGPQVWDNTTPEWSQYQDATRQVAAADGNIQLWEIPTPSPLTDNTLGNYEAGGTPTHPIDQGHSLYADRLLRLTAG